MHGDRHDRARELEISTRDAPWLCALAHAQEISAVTLFLTMCGIATETDSTFKSTL